MTDYKNEVDGKWPVQNREKMADNNYLFSVPCYNGTMLINAYYNEFF